MKGWKSRELVRHLERQHGATVLRQKGSHLRITVTGVNGVTSSTTIPMHARDLVPVLLNAIEKHLSPALGRTWLRDEG